MEGFKALPVKFSTKSVASHWLFCKEHTVREKNESKPAGRTLFIVNVPPYCTQDSLKNVFSKCGEVNAVYFHQKPTAGLPPQEESAFFPKHPPVKGFKVAYVVFKKPSELQNALNLSVTEPLVLSSKKSPIICGVRKWCEEYNARIPDPEAVQKDIDQFMEKFDLNAAKEAELEKQAMEEDNEGWVTVTKRGRKPGFARKESVGRQILAKEKKKRSKKELQNFYTFQIKESKMKHIIALRQKFEEDKKKIIALKQSRRFKPF
ncbi:ribosomal RNA-processing protein 7 homolog A [Bacillus rossius redtenbacheri]|uniref:ribosomal RNA-processing protein 7 homolog A n=1 Tax=Bacillus rossius redtenbacheri TaxID=93214 RepID=UPI002FDDD1CF